MCSGLSLVAGIGKISNFDLVRDLIEVIDYVIDLTQIIR